MTDRLLQAHLLGIFDNVKNVAFDEKDYNKILAIISSEGETVQVREIFIIQAPLIMSSYQVR